MIGDGWDCCERRYLREGLATWYRASRFPWSSEYSGIFGKRRSRPTVRFPNARCRLAVSRAYPSVRSILNAQGLVGTISLKRCMIDAGWALRWLDSALYLGLRCLRWLSGAKRRGLLRLFGCVRWAEGRTLLVWCSIACAPTMRADRG